MEATNNQAIVIEANEQAKPMPAHLKKRMEEHAANKVEPTMESIQAKQAKAGELKNAQTGASLAKAQEHNQKVTVVSSQEFEGNAI